MKQLFGLKNIGRFLSAIGGVLIFVMMIHICADVISKYVFRNPVTGTREIVSAFYMVGIAFLPLLLVTTTESHVSVELFTMKLSERKRAYVNLFAYLFSLGATTLLFYASFDQAIRKMGTGESWETASGSIAIWPSRWIVPVGLGLGAIGFLYLVLKTIKDLRGRNGSA